VDLALACPARVAGLALIGAAVRGAPYPEVTEGPTAELDGLIEAADAAGDDDEVERLEAWLWLDGPSAEEGRVGGSARELFLDMSGRAHRAEDPGDQAEMSPAWNRLREITVPTLVPGRSPRCRRDPGGRRAGSRADPGGSPALA
jgi:pimeloyl-ACP methyl ester carboxylesterase